jgi:hypothetical protein
MPDAASIAKAARDKANGTITPIVTPKLKDVYSDFTESSPTGPTPAVDVIPASSILDAGKQNAQLTLALQTVLNGGNYEIVRTPKIFRASGCAAGNSGAFIWTPAQGKRFRLMGAVISIGAGAVTSANPTIVVLYDNVAATPNQLFTVTINAAAVAYTFTQPYVAYFQLPANGYLSLAANNSLILNVVQVMTTGNIDCTAWGTEE